MSGYCNAYRVTGERGGLPLTEDEKENGHENENARENFAVPFQKNIGQAFARRAAGGRCCRLNPAGRTGQNTKDNFMSWFFLINNK